MDVCIIIDSQILVKLAVATDFAWSVIADISNFFARESERNLSGVSSKLADTIARCCRCVHAYYVCLFEYACMICALCMHASFSLSQYFCSVS